MSKKMVRSKNKIKPFWPELPRARCEFDRVNDLLVNWIELIFISPPTEKNGLLKDSVIHVIECALLLYLSPYASKRGFDSGMFIDANEFSNYCNSGVFQNGYPLEMAEALSTCFSLESPLDMSKEWARKYVDQLVMQLKDLALHSVEESEFWKKAFSGGRKKGSITDYKKYVENAIKNQLEISCVKGLWKILEKQIESDNSEICPFYVDTVDKLIYKKSNNKEYTYKVFQNDVSKLRKINNPH